MARDWFTQEAERMLAERGSKEVPSPLYTDIARLCEKFYMEGITEGQRKIREKAKQLQYEIADLLNSNS